MERIRFESELGRLRNQTSSEFIFDLPRADNSSSDFIEVPPFEINNVVHDAEEIRPFTAFIISIGI